MRLLTSSPARQGRRIPTGFRNQAQRCASGATLGKTANQGRRGAPTLGWTSGRWGVEWDRRARQDWTAWSSQCFCGLKPTLRGAGTTANPRRGTKRFGRRPACLVYPQISPIPQMGDLGRELAPDPRPCQSVSPGKSVVPNASAAHNDVSDAGTSAPLRSRCSLCCKKPPSAPLRPCGKPIPHPIFTTTPATRATLKPTPSFATVAPAVVKSLPPLRLRASAGETSHTRFFTTTPATRATPEGHAPPSLHSRPLL